MSHILQTEKLTYVYGEGTPFRTVALDGVDLSVERGELLAVIGHTGSGKSTLIQHFNGILRPSSGRVLLNGKDIWADKKEIVLSGFRWGCVSSIRSTSFSRRPYIKILLLGRVIWVSIRKKSTCGCGRPHAMWA